MSLYYCSCPNHEVFSSFSFSPCFLESLLVGLLGMPLLYVGLRRALKRDLKDRLRDRVSASDSRELLLESPVGESASGNSSGSGRSSSRSSGRNGHWQDRAGWGTDRQSTQLLWIDEEESLTKTWVYRLRVLLQFSLVMLTLAELAFSFSYRLSIPPFHWTFMVMQIVLFISYLSLSMGHYLSYFSIYCYSGHGFALLSLWILQMYSQSTENLYQPHIQYPTRFGVVIEVLLYILCVLIIGLDVFLKGKSRLRLEEEELENGVILIDHESVEEEASIESEDSRIERDATDGGDPHEDERVLRKGSFRFRRSARGRRRSWQAKIALILPYLWPRDDRVSQSYVMGALVCLCLGRAVNVLVPIMYKLLIDALSDMQSVPTPGSGALGTTWLAMPVGSLLLLFMCLKWTQGSSGALASLQGWLWIRIGQYTTRSISLLVFAHLHRLSLGFHLKRKTGEILRVMDRGTSSIVTLLNNIVFNMLPIMLDIVVASSAFIVLFDVWFGYIVLMTMILFTIATMLITERRARLRRLQNELENRATGRAVDSLLNFETVKSFTAEDIESKLYEDSLLAYQWADWLTTSSLYLLNTVQNTIIHLGTGLGALLCLSRLDEGVSSVGDFVLYFTYMSQLYAPIHMLGTYYRSLQQNFIDMEKMLDLMDEPVEIKDRLHARVLTLQQGSSGDIQFGKSMTDSFWPRSHFSIFKGGCGPLRTRARVAFFSQLILLLDLRKCLFFLWIPKASFAWHRFQDSGWANGGPCGTEWRGQKFLTPALVSILRAKLRQDHD